MARKRGTSRSIVITPLGYRVLRALERGTYKSIKSLPNKMRGKRVKRG